MKRRIVKVRTVMQQGREVKEGNRFPALLSGMLLALLMLALPLGFLIVARSRGSDRRSTLTIVTGLSPTAVPTEVLKESPIEVLPAPTPVLTSVPATPIAAVMTGSVWVWDSPQGGRMLSAAIPQGTEITVVEFGLKRVHVVWRTSDDVVVEGWVNSSWVKLVETLEGVE